MNNATSSFVKTAITTCAAAAAVAVICAGPAKAQVNSAQLALVVQDHASLRASPRDGANSQAQLGQGDLVEVRGERLDYLQVWDYKRERGGYVRTSQLRRIGTTPADSAQLLAVLRFVGGSPGSEGLTFGYSAAWLKAATAAEVNSATGAEVLVALGMAAERLARRASAPGLSKVAQEAISTQLDAAQRYGIAFKSFESDGRMSLCYVGEVFSRILAMPAATEEQRAHAALGLTRSECDDPAASALRPSERAKADEANAQLLAKIDAEKLPAHLKSRLQARRASLWSIVAFDRSRAANPAGATAAQQALQDFAAINKLEVTDDDASAINDAAIRVNASRWASAGAAAVASTASALQVQTAVGANAGESCVHLLQGQQRLAQRCTYGVVWQASFSANREGNAAALAVQTLAGWREMWVFRKQAGAWSVDVLVPASAAPGLGYAELAGWVPGGQQMLVARESRAEGQYRRSFEVTDVATLAVQRQASDASLLGAFQRWQQPEWKKASLSLR